MVLRKKTVCGVAVSLTLNAVTSHNYADLRIAAYVASQLSTCWLHI